MHGSVLKGITLEHLLREMCLRNKTESMIIIFVYISTDINLYVYCLCNPTKVLVERRYCPATSRSNSHEIFYSHFLTLFFVFYKTFSIGIGLVQVQFVFRLQHNAHFIPKVGSIAFGINVSFFFCNSIIFITFCGKLTGYVSCGSISTLKINGGSCR